MGMEKPPGKAMLKAPPHLLNSGPFQMPSDSHLADPGATASVEEAERLAAVAAYLETGELSGPDLQHIVRFAARLFHVPIALVSLVGENQQCFMARIGLEQRESERDISFCAHALASEAVMVVPDALLDPRFVGNPFVTGPTGIRFYAGAPLVSPLDGHRLGTLCILDTVPRPDLSEREAGLLANLAGLAMDRLEMWRVEAQRRSQMERFERMSAATPSGVICTTAEGVITSWNRAAERLFGWRADEAIGQHLDIIVPPRMRAAHDAGMARLARAGAENYGGRSVELSALHRGGEEFPAEITLSSWRDEKGEISFGASVRDISDRRRAEDRLRQLAHYDQLTGLANRVVLLEALEQACRRNTPVALILLDLNGFQQVNDTHGHAVGDELLRQAAQRLSQALGGRGTLARLDGTEFATVLLGTGQPEEAEAVAARLQQALTERPFDIHHRLLDVGATAGVVKGATQRPEALLADAYLALFDAKAAGRNALSTYSASLRAGYQDRRTLQEEVAIAAREGQFRLFYQPQVSLRDGRLLGVEALLRWQHPTRGLLAPGAFLAELENGPSAGPVGDWILEEACRQAAVWRRGGLALRVGVNMFAEQFRRGDLVEAVEGSLRRHGLPPEALEIEVTETVALRRRDAVVGALCHLRQQGVGIAFDDFGTGFASLSTLKDFPLTRLKIDRSFVTDLGSDPHSMAIVEGVMTIAQRLRLEVIAEGIETERQAEVLRQLGCLEGQGYLYGRPGPAEAIRG
jgi:diguanylate cyclase (GGDEF)-like protein/PAS domain S-box-containing protein